MDRIKRRLSILAATTAVVLMCGPALAINGNTWILSCACTTTAAFAQAAGTAAKANEGGGTYLVVSTTNASSAYINVQGGFVFQQGETFWKVSNKYAMDANGNSLAGNTESANESYFASQDQVLWGASRNGPMTVTEPDERASSFINSLDVEVIPGIGEALLAKGIDQGFIEVGTVITVKFTDGTTAQYVKISGGGTVQWMWNGVAHNKANKRIRRDGSVIDDPNTTGNGGGTFGAPGYGPGAPDWFNLVDPGLCQFGGTISFSDGEEITSFGVGPC
jgi:hypothetical protein